MKQNILYKVVTKDRQSVYSSYWINTICRKFILTYNKNKKVGALPNSLGIFLCNNIIEAEYFKLVAEKDLNKKLMILKVKALSAIHNCNNIPIAFIDCLDMFYGDTMIKFGCRPNEIISYLNNENYSRCYNIKVLN